MVEHIRNNSVSSNNNVFYALDLANWIENFLEECFLNDKICADFRNSVKKLN